MVGRPVWLASACAGRRRKPLPVSYTGCPRRYLAFRSLVTGQCLSGWSGAQPGTAPVTGQKRSNGAGRHPGGAARRGRGRAGGGGPGAVKGGAGGGGAPGVRRGPLGDPGRLG